MNTYMEREKARKESWKKMRTANLINALVDAKIEDYEYRHSSQHFGYVSEIVEELDKRFEEKEE